MPYFQENLFLQILSAKVVMTDALWSKPWIECDGSYKWLLHLSLDQLAT